jgi:hypothetical protein
VRDVAPARLEQAGGKRIARRVSTGRTTAHPGAHRNVPEVKADECTKPRTDPFPDPFLTLSMKRRALLFLSATATVGSGFLFVVMGLFVPGILMKPDNWTVDGSNSADLADLKVLVQDLFTSQTHLIYWLRIAAATTLVLVLLQVILFCLIFRSRKLYA